MGAASSNKEDIHLISNESDDESVALNGFDERQERKLRSKRIIDTYSSVSKRDINPKQYEDETNEFVQKLNIKFNPDLSSKTKKLVVPLFILINISAIVMIFTGLLTDSTGAIISLLCIITMTWVGALAGMTGLYLWGSILDGIYAFKQENKKFEKQINSLRKTRNNLKEETTKLHFIVDGLKNASSDLKHRAHEFDELRDGLEQICDENEDADEMIGDMNHQFNAVSEFIRRHERAHLYSIYFEVDRLDKKDDRSGLSKKEYQRFLGRLDNNTKKLFPPLDEYHTVAGDDNNIDLEEFEELVNTVMEKHKSDILKMGFDQAGPCEEKYEKKVSVKQKLTAEKLLKKWELNQYSQSLIDKGFDDVNMWNKLTREDLMDLGLKEEHALKFVENVKNLV